MLIQRTVRLTKLARSALMYLAFAVHAEEAEKQSKRGPEDKILSLPICWMEEAAKPGMKARPDQPNTDSTA